MKIGMGLKHLMLMIFYDVFEDGESKMLKKVMTRFLEVIFT